MAERVGFEPTVRLPVHNISNVAPSTTRPSLRFILQCILNYHFNLIFQVGFEFNFKKVEI